MRGRWGIRVVLVVFPELTHWVFESHGFVLEVSKHVRLASRVLLAGLILSMGIVTLGQTPEQPKTRPVLRSTGIYADSQEKSQQATKKGSNEIDQGSVVRVDTSLIT